jgi:PII-like signaling protein
MKVELSWMVWKMLIGFGYNQIYSMKNILHIMMSLPLVQPMDQMLDKELLLSRVVPVTMMTTVDEVKHLQQYWRVLAMLGGTR